MIKHITNLYRGLQEYARMHRAMHRDYHSGGKHFEAYAEMCGHIQDNLEHHYGHVGLMLCRIVDRVIPFR